MIKVDEMVFDEAPEVDVFPELTLEERAEASFMADIAIAIRNKRMIMNLSQKEFGALFNVSQTIVCRWESGDYNFTINTLIQILTKLDLKLKITSEEEERQNKEIMDRLGKLMVVCAKSPEYHTYLKAVND